MPEGQCLMRRSSFGGMETLRYGGSSVCSADGLLLRRCTPDLVGRLVSRDFPVAVHSLQMFVVVIHGFLDLACLSPLLLSSSSLPAPPADFVCPFRLFGYLDVCGRGLSGASLHLPLLPEASQ